MKYKQPKVHYNRAHDAAAVEHDMGQGWAFTIYDDGSAFIANTGKGHRVDLSVEEVRRLRALLNEEFVV